MNLFFRRLLKCVRQALPASVKTALWLIKLTIPVSFAVLLLDYSGWLMKIAEIIAPAFKIMGLPGESAFVLLTSIFASIYSVIAVITTLHIPLREATILAVMCLISHNYLIETIVLKKTGSGVVRMLLLRLLASFIAGIGLNFILPGQSNLLSETTTHVGGTFQAALTSWSIDMLHITLKIIVLITLLMILQKIMEEFGVIRWLNHPLKPFMKIMGLPENTTLSWIVGNAIGLAYGSAVMMEQVDSGKISYEEADLLNHHLAVSHSMLEDPLLFMAIGIPFGVLIWPRFVLALGAVWIRRAEKWFINYKRN